MAAATEMLSNLEAWQEKSIWRRTVAMLALSRTRVLEAGP